MGSAQSAPSARQDSALREVVPHGTPVVATPNPPNATAATSAENPTENEEGGVSRRKVGRRRSLMRFSPFPSMKRRRSVDECREDSVHPSPSRRRWRAFSGPKSRPVSTIANSSATAATGEGPSLEGHGPSIPNQMSTEKGKEREALLTEEESMEPPQSSGGVSQPDVEAREHELSSDALLRELRELQDTQPTDSDSQSNMSQAPQNQTERPPTPIPISAIESASSSEGEGSVSGTRSNSALVEALGSWMGGRPWGENAESPSGDARVASESHSENAAPMQTTNTGASWLRDSAPPSASPRNTGRTAGAVGSIPPLTVPPGTSRFGSNPAPGQPERRTLPPAGTGTLVVVQGVVHTTDVRHSHAQPHPYPPSGSQTSSAPTRPPRSSSSTPTLRPPSVRVNSRSPSPSSTPQPSSRRSRFSSLTSGLRPRSRPGTASSRPSMGGWGRNPSTPGTPNDAGETPSERSDNFAVSVDRSATDSEKNAAASTSSTGASAQLPNASVGEPSRLDSQVEVVNAIDDLPLPDQPSPRTEGEETQATNRQTDAHPNGFDADENEEEGEAELSASSIEVLGALLSVATAATAASLVTGSTDPLFTSGLAGPNINANATNRYPGFPAQDTSSAGLSPQSTQGMESSTSPESGVDNHNAEAAVNTRMRAAWESLRDRFSRARGRRAAVPGGPEAREDPREQMLREMARAFNAGLGIDPDQEESEGIATERAAIPSSPRSDAFRPDGDGRTPEDPGPGAEGSFERFLHNLQVDLRTALAEDYAARRARAQSRDAHTAAETSSSSIPAQTSTASGDVPPLTSSEPTTEGDVQEEPPSLNDLPTAHGDLSTHPSTVPNTPRPATFDLPSLPGDLETMPDDPGVSGVPPQAHGVTGQPGAGINWWRLYRFPLMQLAPHPSTIAAGGVPAQPQPSPTERPATISQDMSADPHAQTPAVPTNPEEPPTQTVVPVIVVGLQSVPMNRGGAHNTNHHHPEPPSPLETYAPDVGSDLPSDLPPRERRWPLRRAASRALGRMGRRIDPDSVADDATVPSSEQADPVPPIEGRQGGRTYLIFVIGGYYPPNHSIVTGADDMNSFEALWELAELLGQVKPPVASKDDIEKSGLEIIKASRLSDYEQAGKVASNTVERCLICLDDYDREDDLRLLSCRHIFHKQCVDKWLEQGRNNCPACRTKGVPTGDELASPIPTSDNQD